MDIRLVNVKYSPNLGDGLLSECLENALKDFGEDTRVSSVDLAGRIKYKQPQKYRETILRLLMHVPTALRARVLIIPLTILARTKWKHHYERSLMGGQALVIGGGNLFTDLNLNFPMKLAVALNIAAKNDLPVAIYGCGVSGDWSQKGLSLLRTALSQVRVFKVALRDEASKRNWDKHFSSSVSVESELVWDPGVLTAHYTPPLRRNTDCKTIGICITSSLALEHHSEFHYSESELKQWYVALIKHINALGRKAGVFTNGTPEDVTFLNEVVQDIHRQGGADMEVNQPSNPTLLAELISRYGGVVAHRMHAIIPTYSYGIPMIALKWDPKIDAFMQAVHLSHRLVEHVSTAPEIVMTKLLDLADQALIQKDNAIIAEQAFSQTQTLARQLKHQTCVQHIVESPKTLFVTHTGEMGGAELFLRDLIQFGPRNWTACCLSDGPLPKKLASEGHDVLLLEANQKLLGVRRASSPFAILSSIKEVALLGHRLSRELASYDAICANSQKALFVAGMASFLARKPFIWVLHDIITDKSFSALTRTAAVLFSNLFCTLVVVNSKETGEAFIDAGGRASLVKVIYNGFDPAQHPAGSPEAARKVRELFKLDHRPIVGLFGRLTRWKGQQVLLRALVNLPGVQALIVGGPLFGEDKYEIELHNLARSLGVADRVCFAGFREDIPDLMAGVDIITCPSTHPEPFGRVVVEGMLARKPVVAAYAGGIPEIIEDKKTGLLVAPKDPVALANAIEGLVKNAREADVLADAGYKSAVERFSIRRTCDDLAKVLSHIRNRSSRSSGGPK
jgi:glycosyltransferase involved in cell wall biosynthesis/polysaccharide pyruvyl transferase WcaK-like protein